MYQKQFSYFSTKIYVKTDGKENIYSLTLNTFIYLSLQAIRFCNKSSLSKGKHGMSVKNDLAKNVQFKLKNVRGVSKIQKM